MILGIIAFIALLGVLVLVHEWGHFFAARKFGVRVDEFAFGFPPRVASITRHGVRYALNLIPIGGYVKIYGEGGEGQGNRESFSSRPIWQRAVIIAAGVFMNVILAWVLFSAGHAIGLPTVLDEHDAAPASVTILDVAPDSPAAKAGIQFGDVIRRIDASGDTVIVSAMRNVQDFIERHRGQSVVLTVARGSTERTVTVVPRTDPPPGQGALGISMAHIGVVASPWWRAPWDGAKTTATAFVAIVQGLGKVVHNLFVRGEVSGDVSGPVGIFVFANETRKLGIVYLLELAGVLSINLAILNILPVPALDGGRVLFLVIERFRGGVRVNEHIEQFVHTVGMVLLLLLMVAITYRDIIRFF